MELTKDLSIRVHLPVIYENFDEVKTALVESTKVYEIEVTPDNIADAKAASAELNKIKDALRAKAKRHLDKIEAPIKEFKEKLKALESILTDRRTMIVDQVKVFEEVKKEAHVAAMAAHLLALATENNLRDEYYNTASVRQFASVGGLTSTGNLNKKSREQVEFLIRGGVEAQKSADQAAEIQRLKDEARAEELLRQREADAAAKKAATEKEEAETNNAIMEADALEAENEQKPHYVNQGHQKTPEAAPVKQVHQEQEKAVKTADNGRSIYEFTVTYQITAQAGVDTALVADKVMPMIKSGKIPVHAYDVKEVN